VIRHLRLLVVVARPAVLVLLALFAATGAARGGRPDSAALAGVMVVVAAFLLFSVAVNDLADEAVDRVNLPGDRRRPLIAGSATRMDLRVVAGASVVVALAAASLIGWAAVAVTAAGLLVSTAYSRPPPRLAGRGAVASLVLPACYVAVPYLLGLLAAAGTVRAADLVLLAAPGGTRR
jgi:4-hydroxybenzoate polyprenyltransferase